MTNFEIEDELRPNLSLGEKLVWTGKPKTGVVFRSSDFFLIPISLLWAGFTVYLETSILSTGAPFPFAIIGILFVLVGLYITVGRFFLDSKKRANTIYGITADRIIIKTGIFNREIQSLNIKAQSEIRLNQKADNSGTITIGPTDFRYTMMQGMEWPGAKQPPRLDLIENVKSVYDLIIEFQRQK